MPVPRPTHAPPQPPARAQKGLVLFKIDDADWTLDLREDGQPALYSGAPKDDEKPDLTLTTSDANFAQLVMGKLNPQQVRARRRRAAHARTWCARGGEWGEGWPPSYPSTEVYAGAVQADQGVLRRTGVQREAGGGGGGGGVLRVSYLPTDPYLTSVQKLQVQEPVSAVCWAGWRIEVPPYIPAHSPHGSPLGSWLGPSTHLTPNTRAHTRSTAAFRTSRSRIACLPARPGLPDAQAQDQRQHGNGDEAAADPRRCAAKGQAVGSSRQAQWGRRRQAGHQRLLLPGAAHTPYLLPGAAHRRFWCPPTAPSPASYGTGVAAVHSFCIIRMIMMV